MEVQANRWHLVLLAILHKRALHEIKLGMWLKQRCSVRCRLQHEQSVERINWIKSITKFKKSQNDQE